MKAIFQSWVFLVALKSVEYKQKTKQYLTKEFFIHPPKLNSHSPFFGWKRNADHHRREPLSPCQPVQMQAFFLSPQIN